MSKTDISSTRFNNCAQLSHGFSCRLWPMWKGGGGIVVNCYDFTPQLVEPVRNQQRASAITTIYGHLKLAIVDRRNIKGFTKSCQMVLNRVALCGSRRDFVPRDFSKFSLMENVQQFFRFRRIQVEPVAAYELQRVPLRWIVTRGNRDSTVGFQPGDSQLQTGRWTNAEIDHFTASGQQTRKDTGGNHGAGCARVATH